MKYLYYKRVFYSGESSYVAEGCIPIKKILYVEGAHDERLTHVTLSNGEILTIDLSIKTVMDVLEKKG